MTWRSHISTDPRVCHGRPCFSGTRILVSVVLDELASGRSIHDLEEDYPGVDETLARAAIAYAADLVRHHRGSASPPLGPVLAYLDPTAPVSEEDWETVRDDDVFGSTGCDRPGPRDDD